MYTQEWFTQPFDDEKVDTTSQEEAEVKALNSLHRETAIAGLAAYNDLKVDLMSFLRGFADQGKVVSRQDIQEFFESKKQRDLEIERQKLPNILS